MIYNDGEWYAMTVNDVQWRWMKRNDVYLCWYVSWLTCDKVDIIILETKLAGICEWIAEIDKDYCFILSAQMIIRVTTS